MCEFTITFNGYPIKHVTEFRYLGILYDECVIWKSYVESILSKACKRVKMLGQIRNDLTLGSQVLRDSGSGDDLEEKLNEEHDSGEENVVHKVQHYTHTEKFSR